jgi:hypothetical protein
MDDFKDARGENRYTVIELHKDKSNYKEVTREDESGVKTVIMEQRE